ncbi:MAG: thioredoxin family protein [Pseudomonadota bacterium]
MIKHYRGLFLFLFISLSFSASADGAFDFKVPQPEWYSTDADGKLHIHLYFFWSKRCPHCRRALPLMPKLVESYPWLELHAFEVSEKRRNMRKFFRMAKSIGQRPEIVPGFLFCEQMVVGYGKSTGTELKRKLEGCYQQRAQRQ